MLMARTQTLVQLSDELLAQLDAINDISVIAGRYPSLVAEVKARMSEFGCDGNTVYRGDTVTPSLTSGTAFASIYDTVPLDHVDYTDDDSFIADLRDLHGRALPAKEDAGAFSSQSNSTWTVLPSSTWTCVLWKEGLWSRAESNNSM